jgi:hypothetical protein
VYKKFGELCMKTNKLKMISVAVIVAAIIAGSIVLIYNQSKNGDVEVLAKPDPNKTEGTPTSTIEVPKTSTQGDPNGEWSKPTYDPGTVTSPTIEPMPVL